MHNWNQKCCCHDSEITFLIFGSEGGWFSCSVAPAGVETRGQSSGSAAHQSQQLWRTSHSLGSKAPSLLLCECDADVSWEHRGILRKGDWRGGGGRGGSEVSTTQLSSSCNLTLREPSTTEIRVFLQLFFPPILSHLFGAFGTLWCSCPYPRQQVAKYRVAQSVTEVT